MKKSIRSRKRENIHVTITIEGDMNKTMILKEELLKIIRKQRKSQKLSYFITTVDFHQ